MLHPHTANRQIVRPGPDLYMALDQEDEKDITTKNGMADKLVLEVTWLGRYSTSAGLSMDQHPPFAAKPA